MLIEHTTYENGVTIGLWHITESTDELLERLDLDPFVMEQVYQFGSGKRRREFLAVRVMLNEICGSPQTIKYLPSGMPYLADHSQQISITHTGEYAAVILHPCNPVGIDIERVSDKVVRVRHKFLSESELSFVDSRSEKTHLALIWSAKEALYKVMGRESVDFVNDLVIYPFQPYLEGTMTAQENCTEARARYTLDYRVYPEFVIVWVKK